MTKPVGSAPLRGLVSAGPRPRNSPDVIQCILMANDERQSEQFIREVDEELRRAQLKAIWDRFAPLIIGVCVLVVAVTAGYRGWMLVAGAPGGGGRRPLHGGAGGDRERRPARRARPSSRRSPRMAARRLFRAGAACGSPAKRRRPAQKPEAIAAYDARRGGRLGAAAAARSRRAIRAALLALDTRRSRRREASGPSRSTMPGIPGATRRAKCSARPPIRPATCRRRATLSPRSSRTRRRRRTSGCAPG